MTIVDNHASTSWSRVYSNRVLPWLLDLVMRRALFLPHRRRALAEARGRVLEIGVGAGANLELYPDEVRDVIGLDPSAALLGRARGAAAAARRIMLLQGSAEDVPLRSGSVDTVISTWTLCSIPDVPRALAEVRRVLAPGGRFVFVEHGRAPERWIGRWQDRLTPLWRRVAGGCHLNRDPAALLSDAGFRLDRLETGYMRGPKVMTYLYEGSARADPAEPDAR